MDSRSSREIAVAFWTLAALAGTLSLRKVRHSLWQVLKHALFSKLIWVWLSLAAYATLIVLVLATLGVWTASDAKDTAVWFVFVAVTYPFQFHDPDKAPRVLRALLRDSLSVLLVVEVLVQTYTFSLPAELVIVPFITIIAIMGAVAETRGELRPAAQLLGGVQAVIGLCLVFVVIRRALADPAHSFLPALVAELIVVVLSISCYPYILALRLAFAHESMVWRIGWRRNVSRRFQHYAAFRILRHLQFRPTAVAPFVRRNASRLNNVVDRASLEELLESDPIAA